MRALTVLGLALGLAAALFCASLTRETARRHAELESRLAVQEWLGELSRELADSDGRRLFPNRAELARRRQRESRRPSQGLVRLSRTPLEPPVARALDTGRVVPSRAEGRDVVRVESDEAVLLEYPVDDLTIYWVEDGRFYRQRRDGSGRTEMTRLNGDLPVRSLTFEPERERVRIVLEAGSFRGAQVVTLPQKPTEKLTPG